MIEAKLLDHMGTDLSVVNAARVSFKKKSKWLVDGESLVLSSGDQGLIKYLAKHKHMSPFGHCFASFHVKAPIFVARQLVKHEYLRINEVSRRYVDDKPEMYEPTEWRGRATDKKQGSEGLIEDQEVAQMNNREAFRKGVEAYENLLYLGVAPEQARMALPLSMMTEWYWSGSLDAFANMCNLRLKEDSQYESRLVAQQVSEQMNKAYPYSWKELING